MPIRVRGNEVTTPVIVKWGKVHGTAAEGLWKEFVAEIEAGEEGVPKGAVVDSSTDPPTYWCTFPGGGLAQLEVRNQRSWLFGRDIEVVIVNLIFSPIPLGG